MSFLDLLVGAGSLTLTFLVAVGMLYMYSALLSIIFEFVGGLVDGIQKTKQ